MLKTQWCKVIGSSSYSPAKIRGSLMSVSMGCHTVLTHLHTLQFGMHETNFQQHLAQNSQLTMPISSLLDVSTGVETQCSPFTVDRFHLKCVSQPHRVCHLRQTPQQPAPRMAVCYPCSVSASVLPWESAPTGGRPELTWDALVGQAFVMPLRSLRGLEDGDMEIQRPLMANEKKGQYGLPWFWRV